MFFAVTISRGSSAPKAKPESLPGMAQNGRDRVGGASVVQDLKVAKKPYNAPSFQVLDAGAAKAELEAAEESNDADTRQMLAVLNQPNDGKPAPAPSAARSPLP
jgi:hypothetical protein